MLTQAASHCTKWKVHRGNYLLVGIAQLFREIKSMSDEAYQRYMEALNEQHTRNEARRIRTLVNVARRNPHPAGLRWPFELLQNALDSGSRTGRNSVTVRFHREHSKLLFQHDGMPFSYKDLAALLSGGSNKEFESDDLTGRFGTGFLSTHVLAERAELEGLLQHSAYCEQFNLTIDRSGDEESILRNIFACGKAIKTARPVTDLEDAFSADLQYPITDESACILGFDALNQALPYVFITRQVLGRVEVISENSSDIWTAGEVFKHTFNGCYIEERSLSIESNRRTLPEIHVLRFAAQENAAASAIVLIERVEDAWRVRLPEPDAARLYREYPLRGSGFLPVNLIFDGKFDPDPERNSVLMTDKDKGLLENAFSSAIEAVRYAFDQKWEGAHLLTHARKPVVTFFSINSNEQEWWSGQLAKFAERLARLPIIECTSKFLPAIVQNSPENVESKDTDSWYADFIIPRLSSASPEPDISIEKMWPLIEAATALAPPRKELAAHWTEIAEGWADLGLDLGLVYVSSLAEFVREGAETLIDLQVAGDPKEWLAKFLDIVGECWSKRGVDSSVLTSTM